MPIYNTAKQDMKQCVSMANQCSWFDYYAYLFLLPPVCVCAALQIQSNSVSLQVSVPFEHMGK